MSDIKLALVPSNPVTGDIPGNAEGIFQAWLEAREKGADLVLTPEMSLTGYLIDDLATRESFDRAARRELENLARRTAEGPALIVGLPWREEGRVYNALAVLDRGEIVTLRFKHHLPNYGVFDEKRVFVPGAFPEPVDFRGVKIGLANCEDIWVPDVCTHLKDRGAEFLLVPNGSPFRAGKHARRLEIARARARETGLNLIYLNQHSGQDELVFDGGAFTVTAEGAAREIIPRFSDEQAVIETGNLSGLPEVSDRSWDEEVYAAICLGLRDYVRKNRFPGVLLGLSGGIDSALAAAIAADALGPDRVQAIMMPSHFTSDESLEDAAACARNLGIDYRLIPISGPLAAMEETFETGELSGLAHENAQSRLRGLILMSLSNRHGGMLVATGNKSEMAVGYATLYGDMCGGYNPVKDLYKGDVYRLARWRNTWGKEPVIPERILTRPPTAELREDQKDSDTLPEYDELDAILRDLVEEDGTAEGHDRATVLRIWKLLTKNEYKRRQAPPGPKVTMRAFGRNRRYPVTNWFEES